MNTWYQHIKIQYIQIKLWNFISMWRYCMYSWTVPCYLVYWVVCALLLRDDYADKVLTWPCRLPYMLKPHDWTGGRWCEKTCFTVSCIVILDCRRLVTHENVPSNFQAPLFMCVCIKKKVTYYSCKCGFSCSCLNWRGEKCEIGQKGKVGLVRNVRCFFVENKQCYDLTKYLQILLNVTLLLVLSYFSSSSYIFNKVLKRH